MANDMWSTENDLYEFVRDLYKLSPDELLLMCADAPFEHHDTPPPPPLSHPPPPPLMSNAHLLISYMHPLINLSIFCHSETHLRDLPVCLLGRGMCSESLKKDLALSEERAWALEERLLKEEGHVRYLPSATAALNT